MNSGDHGQPVNKRHWVAEKDKEGWWRVMERPEVPLVAKFKTDEEFDAWRAQMIAGNCAVTVLPEWPVSWGLSFYNGEDLHKWLDDKKEMWDEWEIDKAHLYS